MTILFWPFMIASIVFSLIAIAQKKPLFLVVSYVLIIPFSLYLAAMPAFKWWGLFVPLGYLGAALALRKNIIWLTFLLILPVILLIGWLGFLVVTQ